MSNFDIRIALLALVLAPAPSLAIESRCIVGPPRPAYCTFGPAGADYPQGTMLLTCVPRPAYCTFGPAGADYPQGTMVLSCGPLLPQAKEATP